MRSIKIIDFLTGEKYMPSSIFGPRMQILQDAENDDDVIVRCLNCGQPTRYGETRMCSGYVGCDNKIKVKGKEKDCYFGDLLPRVLDTRQNNRDLYVRGKLYRWYSGLGGLENEKNEKI